MLQLFFSSLLFSFSFGLIGRFLSDVDPVMVAFVRLLVATICFSPFFRMRRMLRFDVVKLAAIGAVQYGLMYIVYIYAYRWLAGHEVALFTVTTPLYVSILYDLRLRQLHQRYLFAAVLAVLSGAVMTGFPSSFGIKGVVLIQLSNLCFAFGQVEYKLLCERNRSIGNSVSHFAVLYAGGALLTAFVAVAGGHWQGFRPSWPAIWVLFYLGAIPSALGFYFWNWGARLVLPGVLAAANNIKIPLAVVVSLVVFQEPVIWLRFVPGVAILLASVWYALGKKHGSVTTH